MHLVKINTFESDADFRQKKVAAVINMEMIVSITSCQVGDYFSLSLTGAESLLISAETAKHLLDLSAQN